MDLTAGTLPLDDTRACGAAGCGRAVVRGTPACPVHLGLGLVPDPVELVKGRGRRIGRVLARALVLALIGAAIGAVVGDTRFGWLGGIAAGAQVAARVAREARQPRLGDGLALLAFFAAMVLLFAALVVGTIGLLPLLVGRLLG